MLSSSGDSAILPARFGLPFGALQALEPGQNAGTKSIDSRCLSHASKKRGNNRNRVTEEGRGGGSGRHLFTKQLCPIELIL